MNTDNRTNEVTEAQVEAAAKAIYGDDPAWGYVNDYGGGEVASQWRHLGERIQEMFRLKARAALVAAQGAAPQAVNVEKLLTVIGVALDVTKADVRGEIEASIRREVSHWLGQGDDVVLPSSTVDEGKLEHVIEETIRDVVDMPLSSRLVLARAVVEAIGGERR